MRYFSPVLVVMAALTLQAPTADAIPITFATTLSGANEVPPISTTATGIATVVLDTAAHTISIAATFNGKSAPQMPGPEIGSMRTSDAPSFTCPDFRQATSASCRQGSRSANIILPQAARPRTTREPTRYRATPRAMHGECERFL